MPWELKPFFPSRRDILFKVMKIRLRYARGMSWFSDFKYLIAAFGMKFVIFSDWQELAMLGAGIFSVASIIGYLDEKKGIWKIEQEYTSSELNPFFNRMSGNISKLLKSSKSHVC